MTLPSINPEHSSAGRVWISSEEAAELGTGQPVLPLHHLEAAVSLIKGAARFTSLGKRLCREGGMHEAIFLPLLYLMLPPFRASREQEGKM